MKSRSILLATALVVIAAVAGYFAHGLGGGPANVTPPTAQTGAQAQDSDVLRYRPGSPELAYLQVEAVLALPEPLLEPLNARVAYDENHTARVSSPIAGRVVRIAANLGDTVRAGDSLAWLDSPEFNSAVADATKAEADLRQKQAAFERAKSLLDAEVLSRRDFESALADSRQAQAESNRAQKRLANLVQGRPMPSGDQYALRAPISGVVSERKVNPGSEVRPDAPDPLFVITDPSHLWLVVDLPEKYLGKMTVGQRVSIDVDAYPGGDFIGTVASVGEVLDPATRRVPVRCVIDNPERRLKPEMYARVTPIADESAKLPRIPNASLVTQGLYSYVFVEKEPGVFQKRRVTVGLQGRETSYVKEGLREGERVVTKGALLLSSELAGIR